MPRGPIPETVWPQPPTCSAVVPSRSVRYSSAAHTTTTTESAASVMARCNRGLRPANNVSAAPTNGISTGSGVNTAAMFMRDPPSLLAGQSWRTLLSWQRVELVGQGGGAGRLWVRPVLIERGGALGRQLRDPGVLWVVADFLGRVQPERAVGQTKNDA